MVEGEHRCAHTGDLVGQGDGRLVLTRQRRDRYDVAAVPHTDLDQLILQPGGGGVAAVQSQTIHEGELCRLVVPHPLADLPLHGRALVRAKRDLR